MATALNTLTAKELHFWICKEHMNSADGKCWHCRIALDWNLMHRYCHCGEKARGYRVMSADAPVEFFCDEHFQDIPGRGPDSVSGKER